MFKVFFGLVFGEFVFFFEIVVKVTIFTEFSNNVHVVGSLINIMEFDDVLVVDHFHDIDLGLNIFEVVGV